METQCGGMSKESISGPICKQDDVGQRLGSLSPLLSPTGSSLLFVKLIPFYGVVICWKAMDKVTYLDKLESIF